MKLVIDIDGVVANTPKKMFQVYPQWDWSYNNFPEYIFNMFRDPEFYLSLEPIPSSLSFLLKWKGLIDFVFASTRPIPPDITQEWLEKHGYDSPIIYHVESMKEKYLLTAQLEAIGLIDDAPQHFAPAPFIRFIYSWPYNSQYTTDVIQLFPDGKYQSIYRIHNLKDLEDPVSKYLQLI